MFSQEIFVTKKERNEVKFEEADVVFVADLFTDEYSGGAELTTEALFGTSPYKTYKLKSNELTEQLIQQGVNKTWIFFNFSQMNLNLIPMIVANVYYFITEYDYKFCKYRSIELHKKKTNEECNCHNEDYGKFISSFFAGAEKIFWMSDKQKERYQERFPFLTNEKSIRLSSVFSVEDLEYIEELQRIRKIPHMVDDKWAIIGSNSWIKGVEQSKNTLDDFLKDKNYDILTGLEYRRLLKTLSMYKGLCFMPLGGDTCPRIVIEAQLLGLELMINKNVQHASEEWAKLDRDDIELYLLAGHKRFWDEIERHNNRVVTLSGYTTTKDVINSEYPWKQSIISMLGFCDEVIVADGGSTDGTWEELLKWANQEEKLHVYQHVKNYDDKRFAIFDGELKANARSHCTKDWCWQQDSDEIVHEDDYIKIKRLSKQLAKPIHLLALPVVEYWGGNDKVRCDVNPWKWRLSRNYDYITHGVPKHLRMIDKEGKLYAKEGTDGCDYIQKDNFDYVPCTHFYTQPAHEARILALNGDEKALAAYENWFEKVINELPGVYHYSWFDLERKIRTYKNYWSRHWQSLYDVKQLDTIENNMFFDKKWSDVTPEDIKILAKKLKENMGGWVFHQKINFEKPTPHLNIMKNQPKVMLEE
jgi:glycosyltransferase involved in cell wall biosynthesis